MNRRDFMKKAAVVPVAFAIPFPVVAQEMADEPPKPTVNDADYWGTVVTATETRIRMHEEINRILYRARLDNMYMCNCKS